MCAKAESCLCSICVYVVYEFNVWIKRCYCSVCDCAACKSIWKCEKSIDLLHHVCLYVRKSWVVPLQYMCVCHIWVAACMQRRCCSSVYMQASTCQRSRCYCLAFWLCLAASNRFMREYHHDFDFCFELCYLFSSLRCVDVHHYVFRLFDYCFQFSIVCIYRFTRFISCEFNLHLCQIFDFLISWFLEVRNFDFFNWIQCFLHFVQYLIYLRESVFALLDFSR